MKYTKDELVNELYAVARIFGGDRAAMLEAAAEFIAAGSTAQTPQRDIIRRLDAMGVACDSEVQIKATSARMRSGRFRVDIAVYRDETIVALCECKASSRELTGRQRENYDGCGIPYIVAGRDNIDTAVEWLAARAKGA